MWRRCSLDELEVAEEGKLWAVASYAGLLFGLPVALVPLIQKNDPYALHHAKQSVGTFLAVLVGSVLLMAVAMVLFVVTCGMSNFVMIPLFMLFVLWPVATAVHGIVLTVNESWEEPLGAFGMGDRLFSSVVAEVRPSSSSATDAASPLSVGSD